MNQICCSNEYGIGTDNINEIKPIDTRTDKENACDAIWKELDDSGKEYDLRVAMELAYDKWVTGSKS